MYVHVSCNQSVQLTKPLNIMKHEKNEQDNQQNGCRYTVKDYENIL